MKFLVIGGYSYGNPGDEAILKSTVYDLDELFPGSTFAIWTGTRSFEPNFDRAISHTVFRWDPLPWLHARGVSKAFAKLYTDFFPLSRVVAKAFGGPRGRVAARLAGFDRFVFVGGGYINSDYALPEMNFLSSVARDLDKPAVLLGQTLGPFRKAAHSRMAREIFENARKIVLRDDDSLKEVAGFDAKVLLGADDAIGFRPLLDRADARKAAQFVSPQPDVIHVGLNLRRWGTARRHYAEIAGAIESFAASLPSTSVRVVFVPMETGQGHDDREEAGLFASCLRGIVDYRVVHEDLPVETKHHLISRLDLFVGMRLHSLVFALASGVPTIGLYQGEYYRRKTAGLFERFGISGLAVPLERSRSLGVLLRRTFARRGDLRQSLLRKRERLVRARLAILENVLREEK